MDAKSFIVSVLQITYIAAQGSLTCTFGDNLVSTPPSFISGLLLDTTNPSTCFGIATRWNVCYTTSATDAISTTYFGVYRPSPADNGYTLVTASASNFTIFQGPSAYSCIQLSLNKERQFRVQPGDVIAVCVKYFGNGRLGLVGSQTSNIFGNEGNNCVSLQSAMPPLVSRATGAYQLKVAIIHINLDTILCNGTCDPACVDGTTHNCSFGTPPLGANNGSQSSGVTTSNQSNVALSGTIAAVCTAIIATAVSVSLVLSISCYLHHKRKIEIQRIAAGNGVPQPYLEFQPAHLYDTLAPRSGTRNIRLTTNPAHNKEYEIMTMCKNEAYGI